MSNEDFLGRIITQGFESFYFDLCDVCGKKSPNWIETRKIEDVSEVRITCNDCHSEFLERISGESVTDNDSEFAIYDELPKVEEDASPIDRPEWLQDFIEEGQEMGIIERIGDVDDTIDDDEQKDMKLTEEPLSETTDSNDVSTSQVDNLPQMAPWSAGFIKEALFGTDPVEWLQNQSAFNQENLEVTIHTLTKLSENQITNVKISAIHCLNSINNLGAISKESIINALNYFVDDNDEMVANYASDTIKSLQ